VRGDEDDGSWSALIVCRVVQGIKSCMTSSGAGGNTDVTA